MNLYLQDKSASLEGKVKLDKLMDYWGHCTHAKGMIVTTSCFQMWRMNLKKNRGGKVIPGIPDNWVTEGQPPRVFFLDDNIGLHRGGGEETKGICNLRDITTGEFVDFSHGENGFKIDKAFRHTNISHSTHYRNVLVQVNILDAVVNQDYFTSIIQQYSKPGEKVFLIFDVNGTIVWNDTISAKGIDEVLLNTLFKLAEVRLEDPKTFSYAGREVQLSKKNVLKDVVSDIFRGDQFGGVDDGDMEKDEGEYRLFWKNAQYHDFLDALANVGGVFGWVNEGEQWSPEFFPKLLKEYQEEIGNATSIDGIPMSWFNAVDWMQKERHTVVLNSFGVDTHRVVMRSVPDERLVQHIVINFDLWSEHDRSSWKSQFNK